MSDTVGIAGDRIRSFVERIEQVETELKELNEAKKEIFSEAKGEGFDVKVLKEIIKLRKQDQDERDDCQYRDRERGFGPVERIEGDGDDLPVGDRECDEDERQWNQDERLDDLPDHDRTSVPKFA